MLSSWYEELIKFMKKRIVTSFILVVAVFLFLYIASDHVFSMGVLLISLLGVHEWINLAKIKSSYTKKYLVIFIISVFLVSWAFKYLQFIALVFWIYVIFRLYQYEKQKIYSLNSMEIIILGSFALIPFIPCLFVLHANGNAWLVLFILVIAAADSGAYFVGNLKGKNRMLPILSPNKTIEGLVGGVIFAIVIALVILSFMHISFINYIIMTLICGIAALASVIGDIFESMIKRIAGVKDSGNILPGHGGILDRIDSYLPSLPVFVSLGYTFGILSI